jgi:rubrerythrin
MVLHNNAIDPYDHDDTTDVYECAVCGLRSETGGACPDCDVDLHNTGVARE